MSRIDKIEELLASPQQRSSERAYAALTGEDECWRCGVKIVASELGACAACVEDLRNPAPVDEPEGYPVGSAGDMHDAVMMLYGARLNARETAARMVLTNGILARLMNGLRVTVVAYSERVARDMADVARAFEITEAHVREACGMSTELIGAYPEPAQEEEPDLLQMGLDELARPIANCEHVSAEDGTCDHPDAATPECWLMPDGVHSDCPPLTRERSLVEQLRDANPVPVREMPRGYTFSWFDVDDVPISGRMSAAAGIARMFDVDPRVVGIERCVMNDEDECLTAVGGIACAECPRRAHR